VEPETELRVLSREVVECHKCPRLVEYREGVAREKRRSFQSWDYWGRPVPGFGDPRAQLFILGLAPAAHGGNRTGRVFTGDRSGDFLYEALYCAGFASQPTSTHRDDGLELNNAYVAALVRCAPPANKPLPSEIANCRPYFERELAMLRPRAILVLGGIAMLGYLSALKRIGKIRSFAPFRFGHGLIYDFGPDVPRLFASYHPSQRNTFTGTLTRAMLVEVLRKIRRFLSSETKKRGEQA
jgi:uracil-DNA glycosylase